MKKAIVLGITLMIILVAVTGCVAGNDNANLQAKSNLSDDKPMIAV